MRIQEKVENLVGFIYAIRHTSTSPCFYFFCSLFLLSAYSETDAVYEIDEKEVRIKNKIKPKLISGLKIVHEGGF